MWQLSVRKANADDCATVGPNLGTRYRYIGPTVHGIYSSPVSEIYQISKTFQISISILVV